MKKERIRKPSKAAIISERVSQSVSHLASEDIARRAELVTFEITTIQDEITVLTARLTSLRERRAQLSAIWAGLGLAIDKRK